MEDLRGGDDAASALSRVLQDEGANAVIAAVLSIIPWCVVALAGGALAQGQPADMLELKGRYGEERRTAILEQEVGKVNLEDLIAEEMQAVTLCSAPEKSPSA